MRIKYGYSQIISRLLLIVFTVGFLFCASNSKSAPSAHFYQILPLLPHDAQLIEVTNEMQEGILIDQLVANIFSTPTGRSFCGAVEEDYNEFKRSFFLNDKSAREAFIFCKGFFAKSQIHRLFQKKYFLIITDSIDFAIDGWTSSRNETFLVLSNRENTTDRLTRTLAHELAISLDKKEQIGFLGIIDFPELGIKTDIDSCTTVPILRNAEIKHTLSALRAFDIEKKISTELSISLPQGFADWDTLSCSKKIHFIAPYIQRLSSAIENENLLNESIDQPHCPGKIVPAADIFQKMQALDNLKFTFTDGSVINVCEYMSKGWPYYSGASFRGGPGPRIGGGGWHTLLNNNGNDAGNFRVPIGDVKKNHLEINEEGSVFLPQIRGRHE